MSTVTEMPLHPRSSSLSAKLVIWSLVRDSAAVVNCHQFAGPFLIDLSYPTTHDHHGVAGPRGKCRLGVAIRQHTIFSARGADKDRVSESLSKELGRNIDRFYVMLQKVGTDHEPIESGAVVLTERGLILGAFIQVIPGKRIQLRFSEPLHVKDVRDVKYGVLKLSVLFVCQCERRCRQKLNQILNCSSPVRS